MPNPFVYDFKRTFLRFSTIFFLIIFSLAGIGVSYLVFHFTISVNESTYVKINDVAVYFNNNGSSEIIGYVFNNLGNPIPNAKVQILNANATHIIATTNTNTSGYFKIESLPTSGYIRIIYNSQEINETYSPSVSVTTVNSSTTTHHHIFSLSAVTPSSSNSVSFSTTEFASAFTDASGSFAVYSFIIVNAHNGKADLIVASTEKNANLSYSFTNYPLYQPASIIVSASSQNSTVNSNVKTLAISNYIQTFTISVPSQPEYINFELVQNSTENGLTSLPLVSSLFYPHSSAFSSIVTSAISNAGIFASFFPILMFYLAYTILAKPRDSGALLFLLSKPVTRREIYTNRLLGGSLTGVVAALAYALVTYGVIDYLVFSVAGVSVPINVLLLSFAGIAIELVAFYSLVLMLPTFIKSAGANIGLSIFLYFLFGIIWDIFSIIIGGPSNSAKVSYELDYFNPFGIVTFAEYYIESPYTFTNSYGVIHLPLVILSSALWIIIPAIIGLQRIKKIDI
ncbi:ABC transporter permease subunit [Acidianus manzaensis]|uniref:ABC transporter permease n=1 Tax=Acidianus manzaensis TaxID=282676 RepID=A0A1W6JYB2_9CREN|nr:ABC transporter permease subunit [Acidianus manzaensis]ARM75237.1 hypothetical protein B6F84_03780 [Acidianus manzaensis]